MIALLINDCVRCFQLGDMMAGCFILIKNRLNNRTLSQTMSSNDIISFLIACVRLFWEEGIDLKVVGSMYAKGQKISCDISQPYCI